MEQSNSSFILGEKVNFEGKWINLVGDRGGLKSSVLFFLVGSTYSSEPRYLHLFSVTSSELTNSSFADIVRLEGV